MSPSISRLAKSYQASEKVLADMRSIKLPALKAVEVHKLMKSNSSNEIHAASIQQCQAFDIAKSHTAVAKCQYCLLLMTESLRHSALKKPYLFSGACTGTLLCPDDRIRRRAGSSKSVSEGSMKTCVIRGVCQGNSSPISNTSRSIR